ncbi:hypothetical protein K933_04601 [Candidatus Halobonum tyrrellensis G22]|uniref:Uncharacterized protein n=1 Tax=Candidatus Halobonum tyrrellensis G22 TaxID=1324957 RepID=V4HGM9_9EURY|nr:hypothetical protein K933_04601 [Candidatus Halobonum tyrrellensis G22]
MFAEGGGHEPPGGRDLPGVTLRSPVGRAEAHTAGRTTKFPPVPVRALGRAGRVVAGHRAGCHGPPRAVADTRVASG